MIITLTTIPDDSLFGAYSTKVIYSGDEAKERFSALQNTLAEEITDTQHNTYLKNMLINKDMLRKMTFIYSLYD